MTDKHFSGLPQETRNWLVGIKQAWIAYRTSDKFYASIDSSTAAGWGGSGYSVELFEDGSFRILWDNNIGNLYISPGIILGITQLKEDEWDDDPSIRYYDSAVERSDDMFQEWFDSYSV